MSQLSNKARSIVKEMDKKNDLTCVRVQSTKYELRRGKETWDLSDIIFIFQLVVAPENDYILIVLRDKDKSKAGSATWVGVQVEEGETTGNMFHVPVW